MRISELSSPEARPGFPDHHPSSHILSQIETLAKQSELISPETSFPPTFSADLRRYATQLAALSPFPKATKLHLWKLSYRLWNACVDLSNALGIQKSTLSSSKIVVDDQHVKVRHIAADLLSLAGDVEGIPSPAVKCASFYHKTGMLWHDLKNFDLALTCFERATNLVSNIDVKKVSSLAERRMLLDLNLARSRTAWEISDRNLAINLLNRSKTLLFGSVEHYQELANQYLSFGKFSLAMNEVNEALKLMSEGMDLCEKGLGVARMRNDTVGLKALRSKCLRFVAAIHLQGEEFESVLRCVRVLREEHAMDQHPCVPVLATKAWLGLGKYIEAEKELRGMVVDKKVPEGVWLSAIEAYFAAAGSAGLETVKGLFLGMLERCQVNASTAVRLTYKVVGEGVGDGSQLRAKVVAELVANERVMALFTDDSAAKERTVMHGVLWNCAAVHFRSKDYETSAEMFEKSMLYVPYDVESRTIRAKGFRVLCLCYLGLSQLDRAQEYIDEAEKLEPNITTAFLKFKIYLQKRDHESAINQLQAMSTCHDFTSEFLSLASHEAVSSRALPVAIASLSTLLNCFHSGKTMATTEVVVMRTLLTILTQDPGNETDVLKYMKIAVARMSKLGPDTFLGKGEVGRREVNWLAVNSWNMGEMAGKQEKYSLCAEFLRLASEFYAVLVDRGVEGTSVMVCKSLIFSVSAMIAFEKQKKSPLAEPEVKQAIEMLDKAWKMLTSVSSDITEPSIFFICTFNMYDLYGRVPDLVPQQILLVKSFAASKTCNPDHLLNIGIAASDGPRPNSEAATFALNSCLSSFLSSPSPDYTKVAFVVRKLIVLAVSHACDADDDAASALYRQACRIMVGLGEGEYPVDEGKWLATTAWNRGAFPMRLGQIQTARKWMDLGVELCGKVPGMETYKACMSDFVSAFEKKN